MTMTDETTSTAFAEGEFYAPSDVFYGMGERCGVYADDGRGYICTLRCGHDGQHVGAQSTGRVVHVWDRNPNPRAEVEAFQRRIRETARHIIDSMGYGDDEIFANILARLGIPPLPVRKITAKVRATQEQELPTGWTEEQARSSFRTFLSNYAWEIDDDALELVVEEVTPEVSSSVEDGADTDDVEAYKRLVRRVAIEEAADHDWCDNGLNQVLDRLGLPHKNHDYKVRCEVTARQVVYVTVRASSESEAEDAVTHSDVRNELTSYDWEYDLDDDLTILEAELDD